MKKKYFKRYLLLISLPLLLVGCTQRTKAEEDIVSVEENDVNYNFTENTLELSFKINSVSKKMQPEGTYRIISNNLNNSYDNESLPFISYVLALPFNTDISNVEFTKEGDTKSFKDIELQTLELSTTGDVSTNGLTTENCNIWVNVQSFSGIKVAYISIYPFQYSSQQRLLTWLEEGEVVVSLKEDTWDVSRLESFEQIEGVVDNTDMIIEYEKQLR